MRNIKFVVIVFLLGFFIPAESQILNVVEINDGSIDTLSNNGTPFVDINSSLEIQISKQELIKSIKAQFPQFPKPFDFNEKITLFEEAILFQDKILSILESNMKSITSKEQLVGLLNNTLDQVKDDPALEEIFDELIMDFFDSMDAFRLNQSSIEDYILSSFNKDLSKFRDELSSLESQIITISLIASKVDGEGGERLPIQNFNTYKGKEIITNVHWVVSLTDEQKKKLADQTFKAKENTERALSIFGEIKKKYIFYYPIDNCMMDQKEAMGVFMNDPHITSNLSFADAQIINDIISKISGFNLIYSELKTNIRTWEISKPIDFGGQFKNLFSSMDLIKNEFKSFENVMAPKNSIKQQSIDLSYGFNDCLHGLLENLREQRNVISLMAIQQSNFMLNSEIENKLVSDNLPNKGFINLLESRINEGDKLKIDLIIRLADQDDETDLTEPISVESRTFTMRSKGFRLKTIHVVFLLFLAVTFIIYFIMKIKKRRIKVFVSYNHKDSMIANKIKNVIEEKKIPVIIDKVNMKAGTDIKEFIQNSLREVSVVVSLVSNNSLESVWVAKETIDSLFLENYMGGKKIIACYLDDDFLQDGYTLKTIEKIDKKINEIQDLIEKYHDQRIDTRDLNNQKSRLHELRNNLDNIIGKLRDSLCLDVRDEKFDESMKMLLEAIKNPEKI